MVMVSRKSSWTTNNLLNFRFLNIVPIQRHFKTVFNSIQCYLLQLLPEMLKLVSQLQRFRMEDNVVDLAESSGLVHILLGRTLGVWYGPQDSISVEATCVSISTCCHLSPSQTDSLGPFAISLLYRRSSYQGIAADIDKPLLSSIHRSLQNVARNRIKEVNHVSIVAFQLTHLTLVRLHAIRVLWEKKNELMMSRPC